MHLFDFIYIYPRIYFYFFSSISSQKKERFFDTLFFRGNIMKNNKELSNIEQKQAQTPDTGRSMIEMLGVLAVIGVLSIGGIMGYKYAMTKYQSNKIAHELNLLSNQIAMIMNRPQGGEFELSLGAPYDDDNPHLTSGDYAFAYGCGTGVDDDIPCTEDNKDYYMELTGVSKDICQSLAHVTPYIPNVVIQEINGYEDVTGVHCIDDVAMSWQFNIEGEDTLSNLEPEFSKNPEATNGQPETNPYPETGYVETSSSYSPETTTSNPFDCDQYEPFHVAYANEHRCSNRALYCGTVGVVDCYSYLTACPAGYSEQAVFDVISFGGCGSGLVTIAKEYTNEWNDISKYACCKKN